ISPYQVCETRIAVFLAIQWSFASCPLKDRLTDTVTCRLHASHHAELRTNVHLWLFDYEKDFDTVYLRECHTLL
ncbi:MAG: hypothetical protein ACRYFU_22635, partial [Janthinobacterium lividum]